MQGARSKTASSFPLHNESVVTSYYPAPYLCHRWGVVLDAPGEQCARFEEKETNIAPQSGNLQSAYRVASPHTTGTLTLTRVRDELYAYLLMRIRCDKSSSRCTLVSPPGRPLECARRTMSTLRRCHRLRIEQTCSLATSTPRTTPSRDTARNTPRRVRRSACRLDSPTCSWGSSRLSSASSLHFAKTVTMFRTVVIGCPIRVLWPCETECVSFTP